MSRKNRLLPDRSLPPYTHVPGRTPHPISDPSGHSFGRPTEAVNLPDASAPSKCVALLWGIDLFNHGFYWEAHEAWEGPWHKLGRIGQSADFFKGLIQLAVAGVKHYEMREEGMRRHATRAAELLASVPSPVFFGLSIRDLVALGQKVARDGWPRVFPWICFYGSKDVIPTCQNTEQPARIVEVAWKTPTRRQDVGDNTPK
jgi:hypothetical protein